MRIALFGDIHANLEALNAVLEDSNAQGCTQWVCLGDIVGYNANPGECLELIRSKEYPVVKGNHDEDASGDHSLDTMNPTAATALRWTREQLSDEQRTWLGSLRMVRQISNFTVVHSTLDDPRAWGYVTNRFDATSNFYHQVTDVCFHGHTHVPRVFVQGDRVREEAAELVEVEAGLKYFINIGSVGQPRDGDPRSCYVIYDTERKLINFRRIDYDRETAQQKILDAGLPPNLAERLSDGR